MEKSRKKKIVFCNQLHLWKKPMRPTVTAKGVKDAELAPYPSVAPACPQIQMIHRNLKFTFPGGRGNVSAPLLLIESLGRRRSENESRLVEGGGASPEETAPGDTT